MVAPSCLFGWPLLRVVGGGDGSAWRERRGWPKSTTALDLDAEELIPTTCDGSLRRSQEDSQTIVRLMAEKLRRAACPVAHTIRQPRQSVPFHLATPNEGFGQVAGTPVADVLARLTVQ